MTIGLAARFVRRTGTRRARPVVVVAAGAFLGTVVVVAVLAPLIAPHPPDATDLMNALAPPGAPGHALGTDSTGRDTLSRIIHGARLSLIAPLGVVLLAGVLGSALGLLAARAGGPVDALISRAMDLVFAFPGLLLAMLVGAVFGPGLTAPICALAIAFTPFIGRVMRTVAMAEEARPYVGAYRVMGFSGPFITLRHVLPNALPTLFAQSTLCFGYALIDLASLSYLGLGVQPPSADWGAMISQSQGAILEGSPWSGLFPGLAVVLTVISITVLGEHLSNTVTRTGGLTRGHTGGRT